MYLYETFIGKLSKKDLSYYCNNRFPLHNCWTTNIVIRCRNDQHLQTSIFCAKIHCNVIMTWKKIHKIQGPRIPCIAMPFVVCFQKLSLSEIHKSIVQDCIYNYNIKFCKGCNMRRLVAAKIISNFQANSTILDLAAN